MKTVVGALAALLMSAGVHAAPSAFFADPASGCKVWNPSPQPGETIKWEGRCVDGYAQGDGKLTYVNTDHRSEEVGYWAAGKLVGKYEGRRFDSTGVPQTTIVSGYSAQQSPLQETYRKVTYPEGGYSVDYYVNGTLQGAYRQNATDNHERAAFTVVGGDGAASNRRNVIYLARYNPATKAWSGWPSAADRASKSLDGYALVTGAPGNWNITECETYDSCVAQFDVALKSQGYADWPRARMDSIDAAWEAKKRTYAEAEAAAAAHTKFIATAQADKLFTYGSRQEQEHHYDRALDAYRAIIERFPKSRLIESAASRMAAVQDKVDAQGARADAAQAQAQAQAAAATQRANIDAQRLQMEQQRQEADKQRRLVAYNQCKASADKCTTDCLTTAGAGVIGGIAGLMNRNAVNTNGLQTINQRAQDTCSRCESMSNQCELMKP
ncbi:hypothetical protein [Ralstonia sp. ASV6]|uniref:hypothetical protein n=1 Tax=Ralstonia sp. ASV6 TaxID=2795124 RepID=UPI0018EE2529|nr:hypothetical protein [Ralstonia sp. ASV6]